MIFILLRHDVLLYVNDGCGLNNCYSIKCNKQQEQGQRYVLRRRRQNWNQSGLDHGSDHGSDHRKSKKKSKTFMS